MSVLHLTYDDGPSAQTAELLDVLEEFGARATFFVIAPLARAHPAVIERMLAAGHAVELHCHEHVRHTELSREAVEADTRRALSILGELGVAPTLWRTPWGVRAPWTAEIAARAGLRLVDWTHDTHDWRGDSAESMFAVAEPALQPDAIVLAHDGLGPGATRPDVSETIALTRLIGAHAGVRGMTLAAIG